MIKKTKDLHIRIDEDTARYIDLAVSLHQCSKTQFVTKQILRPEYYEIKLRDTKPLLNLMSNVASNLNQIARAMNVLKKNENKLTEQQYRELQEQYAAVRKLFREHEDALKKSMLEFYNISKKKKIRSIQDEINDEFSNIANEGVEKNE